MKSTVAVVSKFNSVSVAYFRFQLKPYSMTKANIEKNLIPKTNQINWNKDNIHFRKRNRTCNFFYYYVYKIN